MFGHHTQCHVWCKTNTAYHITRHASVVVGGVMIWSCFAATRPGELAVFMAIMNSTLCQNIFEINVRSSVQPLKPGKNRSCDMQQNSDTKHTSKMTSEGTEMNVSKFLNPCCKILRGQWINGYLLIYWSWYGHTLVI